MADLKQLEIKIKQMEKRIEALELAGGEDPLYDDAKRLVTKHGKSSIIFLQRHLMVDFDRAVKLKSRLESEGIVGRR